MSVRYECGCRRDFCYLEIIRWCTVHYRLRRRRINKLRPDCLKQDVALHMNKYLHFMSVMNYSYRNSVGRNNVASSDTRKTEITSYTYTSKEDVLLFSVAWWCFSTLETRALHCEFARPRFKIDHKQRDSPPSPISRICTKAGSSLCSSSTVSSVRIRSWKKKIVRVSSWSSKAVCRFERSLSNDISWWRRVFFFFRSLFSFFLYLSLNLDNSYQTSVVWSVITDQPCAG